MKPRPVKMVLTAVTFDCRDPRELAMFYQGATGLSLAPESSDDFAGLRRDDGLFIGFQRVADYQSPNWPSQT